MTAAEIAKLVNGKIIGDKEVVITGISGIKEAGPGEITFLANQKYSALALKTKASAVLVARGVVIPGKNIIETDNPSIAFSTLITAFVPDHNKLLKGIHPSAVIAKNVELGKDVAVGPFVVIEQGAKIGNKTIIHAACYIGPDSVIGEETLLYPHVMIRERITIGKRVIIHSGTVVGSDGFGFIDIEGVQTKIPQVGTVVIEDDVEIGANVTIDRARFDKTLIGRGTKIDNLVQIGHNSTIGENCILVAQVGIGGSSEIKNNVIFAGQSGVIGHLTIGEGVVVMARTGVSKSVPPFTQVSGFPSREHSKTQKANAHLLRMDNYVKTIDELKKRVESLEKKLGEKKA